MEIHNYFLQGEFYRNFVTLILCLLTIFVLVYCKQYALFRDYKQTALNQMEGIILDNPIETSVSPSSHSVLWFASSSHNHLNKCENIKS